MNNSNVKSVEKRSYSELVQYFRIRDRFFRPLRDSDMFLLNNILQHKHIREIHELLDFATSDIERISANYNDRRRKVKQQAAGFFTRLRDALRFACKTQAEDIPIEHPSEDIQIGWEGRDRMEGPRTLEEQDYSIQQQEDIPMEDYSLQQQEDIPIQDDLSTLPISIQNAIKESQAKLLAKTEERKRTIEKLKRLTVSSPETLS